MFKMIKENELRFPEKVEVSKEGKDFILHVPCLCVVTTISLLLLFLNQFFFILKKRL